MTDSHRSPSSRILDQLGGPAAVTIWTWLATAPFALTFMSGLQYIQSPTSPGTVLAVAAVAHVGVGFLLLVARAALELSTPRFRPATALVSFAVIGAARPFLLLGSADLVGAGAVPGDLPSRIAINVLVTVTTFSLIALVVDLVREHRVVFGRLQDVHRAAAADAAEGRRRVDELRNTRTATVVDAIEREVGRVVRPGLEAATASSMLRAIANDVVRPLSHQLFDGDEHPRDPALAGSAHQPWSRAWFSAVAAGMRPAPALFTAVVFALLTVPYALSTYGIVVTAVQATLGGLLVFGGNRVVSAVATRTTSTAARSAALVIGYAATGGLLVIESCALLLVLGLPLEFVWFQGPLYPVIALTIAFVVSLSGRLDRDQDELQRSVLVSVESAARARAAYEHERARLAHLLHSTVQSDLIATALALRADATVDASTAVREAVERIHRALDASSAARPDSRERLAGLLRTWESAIPLRTRVAPGVWDALRDDVRCQAVIDTVSEGLANAVRHGDGSPVTLEIVPADDGVRVVVTSGGRVAVGRPGIGLRDLARAGEIDLRNGDTGVELAVTIR